MDIKVTAAQVAAISHEDEKVYVFVEPTPEIVAYYGCTPDEHQGAHCCSFVLDNQASTGQAMALTAAAAEVHGKGDPAPEDN